MNSKKLRVSNKLDTQFYNILDKFLIILIILLVLLFIFWPIMCVIKESFLKDGNFTLNLYKDIFKNNKKLIYNSVFVSCMCTIFTTLISTSIAFYVSFSSSRIRKIITVTLMLTMISPPFVSSLAYINLFGRRGFITHGILKLTLNTYGWQGIVIMETLGLVSMTSLLLIGIIGGIDKNFIDASLDLGAGFNYTLIRIVLSLIKPGIIVSALLAFVRSLSDFGTPMIIGGSFQVLATEVYMNIIANGNFGMAAAMSVLILIPSLIAFLIYRFYMSNFEIFSKDSKKLFSEGYEYKIKGVLAIILKVITYLFLLVMIMQYISIFLSAITNYKFNKMFFTLDNIKRIYDYNLSSFGRSIVYSLITGLIGSLLGILISYYVDRRKVIGGELIDFISTLPYIIPGTFLGIGYIFAFNKYPLELTGTAFIVITNCIFKQIPMTTKMSSAVLSGIDLQTEEAAKDLGAPNIFIIKDIILPMLKPAFLVGFINNFTSTMTTIGAIIFLIYPGQKVATVEMFDAIQSGEYGVGSAMASLIIIITLIINILFTKFIIGGKYVSKDKQFSQSF
ncbi:iron ABC transporter permease [Clostridium botulinum]|uniref:ABC transporter permease n=1 Tax=Clostridium botulinum TaxID=1491 RepID=UPI00016BBB09|nr:iron ABC transporter permease [Clostridium botulinum]AJD26291.1 binding--dependent transport system inner membrane component family protein [Clostridium botulinum CDC_297]APQ99513.1 binding--dependent transport system inner membrane component family protein [Clostridium botulinum]APU60033.1 binding--dependent transport system inner membrane component family protein [Clostridium botulinum]AUN02744.1 iron ABC transporter permease [Clostridium botulinum]EDT85849.1 ABC transporter, permease pro